MGFWTWVAAAATVAITIAACVIEATIAAGICAAVGIAVVYITYRNDKAMEGEERIAEALHITSESPGCNTELENISQYISSHDTIPSTPKIKVTMHRSFPKYETYCPESEDLCDEKYVSHFRLYSHMHSLSDTTNYNTCDKVKKLKFIEISDYNRLLYDLEIIMTKLVQEEKIFEPALNKLLDIIEMLDSQYKLARLVITLETLWEYGHYVDTNVLNIVSESTPLNILQNIFELIKNSVSEVTNEVTFSQLIDELKQLNKHVEIGSVENKFTEIQEILKGKSKVHSNATQINKWNKNDIQWWSTKIDRGNDFQNEKLAVIQQAIEVGTGKKLRDIQMLSIIILINDFKWPKGRLAQINTGEGKTLIMAFIAAYHILTGRIVDIVTSSPILVKEHLKEVKNFYDTLGITAFDICDHNDKNKNYKSDILIGTRSDFQGDILRDEFRGTGVRCCRDFDVVMIDEADNELIDSITDVVLLTSALPTMKNTENIVGLIWKLINQNEHSADEINTENFKNEILRTTEERIRNMIDDTNSDLQIPCHLKKLINESHLKTWIKNAFDVKFYYMKDTNYVILENRIVLVDALNTGTLKKNTQISGGIQQFLQIKHGLELEQESIVTNFISTPRFFSRYNYMFGMTATIGSECNKKFLEETFNIDSVIIPPFKKKIFKLLSPITEKNRIDWQFQIVKSCIRRSMNGQAVLIIMEYIKEIDLIKKVFIETFNYNPSQISLFKIDDDASVVNETLGPGRLVMATNIAGRGVDFKASNEVNKNGGLHVCLTFKPDNSRVGGQKGGRTARAGLPGTLQYVLCSDYSFTQLEEAYIRRENDIMENVGEKVPRVIIKDKIFNKFSVISRNIRGREKFVRNIEKEAVEERFGIWLETNSNVIETKTTEEIFNNFKEFNNEILTDDRRGKLIKNPYFFVLAGKEYFKHKKYSNAIQEFDSAIALDKNFAEEAYYYRALTFIVLSLLEDNKNYIGRTIEDFDCLLNLTAIRTNSLFSLREIWDRRIFRNSVDRLIELQFQLRDSVRTNKKLIHTRQGTLGYDEQENERLIEQIEGCFNRDFHKNYCVKLDIKFDSQTIVKKFTYFGKKCVKYVKLCYNQLLNSFNSAYISSLDSNPQIN